MSFGLQPGLLGTAVISALRSGPAVVAQPLPKFHQLVLRQGGQTGRSGGRLQKPAVVLQHRPPAMKKKVTQALTEVIPLDAPGDFNQALMELGAVVCIPNGAAGTGIRKAREATAPAV